MNKRQGLFIIIPIFNEKKNLNKLINKIFFLGCLVINFDKFILPRKNNVML